jgi:integrase
MAGVKWEKTRTPGVYRRDGARGRHYRHVYRDGTGKQVNCFAENTLADAEAHQREMLNDRPEDVTAGRITFRAVYDEMVNAHAADGGAYAPATLAVHDAAWAYLRPLGEKQVGKISASAVENILKKIPGAVMRDRTRTLASTVFAFALYRRYVTVNPVARPRKATTRAARMRSHAGSTKRHRILTEDELARLVVEMPERYRALVELMAYCGLRPGEAVSLTVGKLDALNRTLEIDTSVTGFTKTGEARTLVLPAVVVGMLTDHLARFSDPADPAAPMFPKEDGGAIDSKNAYDAWSRRHFGAAAKRADVNHGLSPNDCRHMAAARAIAAGADVYAVATMLGHARPSITLDVYGYLWEGSLEAVADKLDGVIREARAIRPTDARVVRLG